MRLNILSVSIFLITTHALTTPNPQTLQPPPPQNLTALQTAPQNLTPPLVGTNTTNSLLGEWPNTLPYRHFIGSGETESINILRVWPFSETPRWGPWYKKTQEAINDLMNEIPPENYDVPVYEDVRALSFPVSFDLGALTDRKLEGREVGFLIWQVRLLERQFGAASFSARWVQDDVEVAEFRLLIALGEDAER